MNLCLYRSFILNCILKSKPFAHSLEDLVSTHVQLFYSCAMVFYCKLSPKGVEDFNPKCQEFGFLGVHVVFAYIATTAKLLPNILLRMVS